MRPARHMPNATPNSSIRRGAIKSPSRQPGRALAMFTSHANIATGAIIWSEFTISGYAFKGNQICVWARRNLAPPCDRDLAAPDDSGWGETLWSRLRQERQLLGNWLDQRADAQPKQPQRSRH